MNNEKIIITMTSWSKRLINIPCVLDTIFKQTIKPNNIVINLSVEEFQDKEKEIPNEVLTYIHKHDNIIINWVDGKNIKSWKKTIPTFKLFSNDVIINIDDDVLYPENFIETLWNKHLEYPNNPITSPGWIYKGFQWHCGQASLDMKKFYDNDIDKWLLTDITNYADEDSFMTFMAIRHGNELIPCEKIELKFFNEFEPIAKKDGLKAYLYACNILNDKLENYIKLEKLFLNK